MARILYVEDDPAIAKFVRRWLAEDGLHVVLYTPDGQSALALAASEHPDLVLLDLKLGEFSIDGWEINRRLKADPATRSLPVIALTAHAQSVEDRELALSQGFVDYFTKPFGHDELIERVGRHVKGDVVR